MESSISLTLANQVALWRRLELVVNNMANADTAGFKLEEQVVQRMPRKDGQGLTAYPLDRGSFTDLSQGTVTVTGNPLDIAIQGDGFIGVQAREGARYTRDGRLSRAADGTLLASSGDPIVASAGGTLQLPEEAREITITTDGTVMADNVEIGRIGVFSLAPQNGISRDASGLYSTDSPPQPLANGHIVQGALEKSNVEPIRELTSLLELQRGYDRAQRLLDGEDDRIRQFVDHSVKI